MATLKVYDLAQSITMTALMNVLWKNDLKKLLIKTYPRDFTDMLNWVKKYAHMEDAFMQKEFPATSLLRGGGKL